MASQLRCAIGQLASIQARIGESSPEMWSEPSRYAMTRILWTALKSAACVGALATCLVATPAKADAVVELAPPPVVVGGPVFRVGPVGYWHGPVYAHGGPVWRGGWGRGYHPGFGGYHGGYFGHRYGWRR
jgi:hypothetical protein